MSTSPSFRSWKLPLILILLLLIGGITVSAVSGTNSIFSQLGLTAGAFFSSELSSTTPADPNAHPQSMPLAPLPTPTPIPLTAIDDAGPDDEPGQKDLNFLTVDYNPPTAGTINVIWGWDDTGTSGANTLDACSLFDTDSDGKANYSFCMIINSDDTYSSVL